MKTKTKAFLIAGIAMIALYFTLDMIYYIKYDEYTVNVGKCLLFTIDDRPVNDFNSIIKSNKIRELKEQNPAALEDMNQECLSKYSTTNLNILGWIDLVLLLAGIALVIVAIVMIMKDRRRERERERERERITPSPQKEQEEKEETKDKEF